MVETTSNVIEHPHLIAQRILNYARLVGPERAMAGTDCGFATLIGQDHVVDSIVWAKLRAIHDGAHIASEELRRP